MENDVNAAVTFVVNSSRKVLFLLTLCRKTEKAHAEIEVECTIADRKLHEAEANSTSLKSQLKTKREDLKGTKFLGST